MAAAGLPSFDLVVATVGRVQELERLLSSLEKQTYGAFRILLVDQNDDDRLSEALSRHPGLEIERLRAPRGLSRARNAALARVTANLVAFPDDDCVYPADLLERVARRFAADPRLDGLTGRAADFGGDSSPSWPDEPAHLTRANLWHRALSITMFLRRAVIHAVGPFDEQLGLGSGWPWSSGEETDYLVRALDAGLQVDYDPELVVLHHEKTFSPSALRSAGAREGASIGYILRKHGYPRGTVGRMLIRPVGGALLALARRDRARAGFHLSTLRGRVLGYRGWRRARRS
ncbi:MAG: glycosyltransferase family A protein [Gaiellaceae bacterium]